MTDARPTLRLQRGADARLRRGHPWVFSNEVAMTAEAKAITPGTVVRVETDKGETLCCAYFNPHSLIPLRRLHADPDRTVDADSLAARIGSALETGSASGEDSVVQPG